MANAAANLAAAEAPSFTPDTPPAPAPDYGPSGSPNFGSFSGSFDTSGTMSGGDYAKGGKVNIAPQMFNPPGPDDRYAALQNGEYVIKKKSTKKYGDDVLSQINAGQIPARRLKSLLE